MAAFAWPLVRIAVEYQFETREKKRQERSLPIQP